MKCREIYLSILVLQSVYLWVYLCFCLLFSSRTWASRLFFDNFICWISFRNLEVWSCSVWSFWFLSSWSRVRILIRSWSRLDFVAFSVSYYGFHSVQTRLNSRQREQRHHIILEHWFVLREFGAVNNHCAKSRESLSFTP